MGKKYELKYLSEEFYKKYNSVDYPEIEKKKERPYMVMLIKIENNTFAIPFRTNVKHTACYRNGELNEYETKKYQFSTLRYFHNELEIESEKHSEITS